VTYDGTSLPGMRADSDTAAASAGGHGGPDRDTFVHAGNGPRGHIKRRPGDRRRSISSRLERVHLGVKFIDQLATGFLCASGFALLACAAWTLYKLPAAKPLLAYLSGG
jgi:hypothetical protein